MKVKLVAPDTIEILLDAKDIKEYNLSLQDFSVPSLKIQSIISKVCSTSREQFGIDFSDHPVMVEVCIEKVENVEYTSYSDEENFTPERVIIQVTKADFPPNLEEVVMRDMAKNNKQREDVNNTSSMFKDNPNNSTKNKYHYILCTLDNLEYTKAAAKYIKPIIKGESMLYKTEHNYILAFKISKRSKINISFLMSMLDEFGVSKETSEMEFIYLNEHHKLLMKKNAVKLLLNY